MFSNSQFFSISRILFHTSAAVSPFSLYRSKESDRLCCTFRSGVYCNRNRAYSLCSGRELGSLSLTVLVISVRAFCPIAQRKMYFSSVSNCSRYCGNISLEFTIGEMSISFVIFTYWTNFRHHRFAFVLSFFSRLGMDSFWVQVRSPVLIEVSLSGGRVLEDWSSDRLGCSPFVGGVL